MKRKLVKHVFVAAVLSTALLVAVLVAGCGTAAQGAAQTNAPTTPQEILQQALANARQVTSGTGTIDVALTITGDQTKLPAGAQALLAQPIKISGTYAFDKTAKAAQASLTAAIAGQSLPVGLEATDGQAWIQFMGQWYQAPAKTGQADGGTTTTAQSSGTTSVQQTLAAAGVDPNTWLTNLQLVGVEKLDGADVSHISATVNLSQMAADMSKLPAGKDATTDTSAAGSPTSEAPPTQQEMQQLQAQLSSSVQSLTLDVWVSKDTGQFRKVEVRASIVPPAETAASVTTTSASTGTTESQAQAATKAALEGMVAGIKSVAIDATISFAAATSPLKVTPRTGAKPWGDLQTTLRGFTSLFSGALGESTSTSAQ